MQLRRDYLVLASLFLVLVSFSGFQVFSNMPEQPSNSEKDVTAWNCIMNTESCHKSEIERTYTECKYYYGSANVEDRCNMTQEGISDVSLFTGPANHITAPITDENYTVETRNYGLKKPWNLEHVNRSTVIISELNGTVNLIHEDDIEEQAELDVYRKLNGGLMGLETHPDFEENNKIYVMYSYGTNSTKFDKKLVMSRISSFRFENGELENETVLINQIPGTKHHLGGRLRIGPDDMLYATTGDAKMSSQVQNISFLGGKVLRITLDGDIPGSNPFGNEVYALGLRNPQGIDFHPELRVPYTSSHGSWRKDEINRIKKGGNYNWPEACTRSDPTFETEGKQPLFCVQNWTLAPSGISFVDNQSHPWYGDLFVSSLRGNHVHRFEVKNNGDIESNEIFYFNRNSTDINNRIRDVEFRNGELWVLADTGGLAIISATS